MFSVYYQEVIHILTAEYHDLDSDLSNKTPRISIQVKDRKNERTKSQGRKYGMKGRENNKKRHE